MHSFMMYLLDKLAIRTIFSHQGERVSQLNVNGHLLDYRYQFRSLLSLSCKFVCVETTTAVIYGYFQ